MLDQKKWKYTTRSHCVLITGTQSDKNKFEIADPYIKWKLPRESMFYKISAKVLYKGMSDNKNGYIY